MKLEHRDPRWFEFDDIDGITLNMRGLENRQEPMAPFKFVQHRFKAKSGLPIRGGFARMVAWFYLFGNYAVRNWVEFIATYGQPFRIGKFPPGAGEEDKAILLRALTNLGTDAAAMIPESMMLEFAQVSGSGGGSSGSQATAHGSLLEYIDSLISKAVLGQTLTTEAGEKGARSLGEVHDEVRHDIKRSDAMALSQTLSRDLVRSLVALNRGERKRYPQVLIGREETIDIERISRAYQMLAPLGLKTKKAQWYEILGLDAPEEDDEIDRAIDQVLAEWEPLVDGSVDPVRRTIREVGDLATLSARTEDGSLFASMDSEDLARVLHRMAFSADISGAG